MLRDNDRECVEDDSYCLISNVIHLIMSISLYKVTYKDYSEYIENDNS